MLDPYQDKSGYALCAVGLMSNRLKSPKIFIGKTSGNIVRPRGDNKFGWDPIFEPTNFSQTYA
jgi:inosine triphosphate pyrophosphatase